jgi:hypothetical protein
MDNKLGLAMGHHPNVVYIMVYAPTANTGATTTPTVSDPPNISPGSIITSQQHQQLYPKPGPGQPLI